MGTALVPTPAPVPAAQPVLTAKGKEVVLMDGDLSHMTPDQRLAYIYKICEDIGVNPMTRPFEYLTLNGKLALYARKDCTDQLRANRKISTKIVERIEDKESGTYSVVVEATGPDGRSDQATGSVAFGNPKIEVSTDDRGREKKKRVLHPDGEPVMVTLKGEDRANAIMKAETKAKRRATLSYCGLGFLDESEIETIPKKNVQSNALIRPDQSEQILLLVDNDPAKLKTTINGLGIPYTSLGRLTEAQADDVIGFLSL